MRPSPRLSFFAAACATAMMALPTVARTYEYTLTSAPEGWTFSVSGNTKFSGNGYCFANADAQMQTAEFDGPITNIVFTGYRTSSCNRQIKFTAGDITETWLTGTLVDTSLSEFKVVELPALDDIRSFNLKSAGGSQNFYLKTVVVYIADVPTVAPIEPRERRVGSNGILGVEFGVDLHGVWEQVDLSVTAENLDSPETPIPANSYEIDDDIYGHGRCFFYFTPATAGITSGRIQFTITATGQNGSTSQSFICTVVQGVVKSPPMITSVPIIQGVKANHLFTGGIEVTEADGDEVEVTVSANCNGPYAYDKTTGEFTFTPTQADVDLSPITFTVQATDPEDTVQDTFVLYVEPTSTPIIPDIAPQIVIYGSYDVFEGTITETDEDPIISSNITVKAETEAPVGEVSFLDPFSLFFEPDEADIGKTFTFTASATDIDGTTNVDFQVSVIVLAAPVLKHCPVEDWTPTSFTADIEAAVPGATGYNLRYIHHEDDGTPVTNTVPVASFPHVVSGLVPTNYVYDVQAIHGSVTSAWSNAKSINLHAYIAPTYAIPMTGAARGTYHQDFTNNLISSGSAYWYDARTIPGWYAAYSGGSMSDIKYASSIGDMPSHEGSGDSMILSCQVDDEHTGNRALGARAQKSGNDISFGVVFTNLCRYAVTNLHVSFKAMQFRQYNDSSSLTFSYARSTAGYTSFATTPQDSWKSVTALDFTSLKHGSSGRLYPPEKEPKSADIPFEGESAIQPGEIIALRWFLNAVANRPTLGIDDLDVTWKCAWPCHTIFSVR